MISKQATVKAASPVIRGVASLVGLALMTMSCIVVWAYTDGYATHFCKWPATISCGDGSAIWWVPPAGLVAMSLAAALGLMWWAYFGENGHQAWLLVAWIVCFPIRAIDREFGLGSLLFFAVYVPIGVLLLARMGGAWFPQERRILRGVAVAFSMAYLALLAALPSYLESVAAR